MRDSVVRCNTDASIRCSNAGKPLVVMGVAIDDGQGHYLTSSALPENPMRTALTGCTTDAELAAALDGLLRCARAGYDDVVHITDNKSAHWLLTGRIGTKSPATAYLATAIHELAVVGDMRIRFEWVRRRYNQEADALASKGDFRPSVIPAEIGAGYALRAGAFRMIEALRVPLARAGRRGFSDVVAPRLENVMIQRGVVYAEHDASPRAILLAAAMLTTTPPAWRMRLDFADLGRRQATATIGEIASAWIWRHAADLTENPRDLIVPEYLPDLLRGTAPGLALVDTVWSGMAMNDVRPAATGAVGRRSVLPSAATESLSTAADQAPALVPA